MHRIQMITLCYPTFPFSKDRPCCYVSVIFKAIKFYEKHAAAVEWRVEEWDRVSHRGPAPVTSMEKRESWEGAGKCSQLWLLIVSQWHGDMVRSEEWGHRELTWHKHRLAVTGHCVHTASHPEAIPPVLPHMSLSYDTVCGEDNGA